MALFLSFFLGTYQEKTLSITHFSGHEVSDTAPVLLPKLVLELKDIGLR